MVPSIVFATPTANVPGQSEIGDHTINCASPRLPVRIVTTPGACPTPVRDLGVFYA